MSSGDRTPVNVSSAMPAHERSRVGVGSFRDRFGTTSLAVLFAALAVALYLQRSTSDAVADRLSFLLGARGVQQLAGCTIAGQVAADLDEFPALPPLADRNRLWPPTLGENACANMLSAVPPHPSSSVPRRHFSAP